MSAGLRTCARRRRTNRRRAAVLLEFVFTLPLTLAMTMFIVDAGRVFIATGSVNDAAWRAARSAAVQGRYDQASVEAAFYDSLSSRPAGVLLDQTTTEIEVLQGACSSTDPTKRVIRVRATAQVPTLTPGMTLLLGSSENFGGWSIAVVGVARCEVFP